MFRENTHYLKLFHAMQKNKLDVVEKALQENPQLLLKKEVGRETFLHSTLRYGTNEMLTLVLRYAKQLSASDLTKLFFKIDTLKQNVLHVAVRFGTLEKMTTLIEALGDKAQLLSLKLDTAGQLPIDHVALNCDFRREEIHQILEELILASQRVKPLQAPIDFTEITTTYQSLITQEPEVLNNLWLGWFAATHARKYISASRTHPSSNHLDAQTASQVNTSVGIVRKGYKSQNITVVDLEKDIACLRKLKNIFEQVKTVKAGNCYEYSALVLFTLAKLGIAIPNTAIFKIENGDHHIVVIGYQNKKTAVVVDAWGGLVYPFSEMPTMLRACYLRSKINEKRYYFFTIPYDRDHHKIKFSKQIMFTDTYFSTPRAADYAEFTTDEIEMIKTKFAPPESKPTISFKSRLFDLRTTSMAHLHHPEIETRLFM